MFLLDIYCSKWTDKRTYKKYVYMYDLSVININVYIIE